MKILLWVLVALFTFSRLQAQEGDATKAIVQKWLKEKQALFYSNRTGDLPLQNLLRLYDKMESAGVICAPPEVVQEMTVEAERLSEQNVLLNWQATTTEGVEGYILERSFKEDGPYERVGYVSGALQSGGLEAYQFLDNNSFSGKSYYRVVQVMTAGRQMERKATAEGYTLSLNLNAYPNPSASHFRLSIQSRLETPVQLRVIDVLGRVVEQKSNLPANTIVEVGAMYQSGVYLVEVQQGDKKKQLKLQKNLF